MVEHLAAKEPYVKNKRFAKEKKYTIGRTFDGGTQK